MSHFNTIIYNIRLPSKIKKYFFRNFDYFRKQIHYEFLSHYNISVINLIKIVQKLFWELSANSSRNGIIMAIRLFLDKLHSSGVNVPLTNLLPIKVGITLCTYTAYIFVISNFKWYPKRTWNPALSNCQLNYCRNRFLKDQPNSTKRCYFCS